LRVNPDVDARTHAKISTGKSENKFGIPISIAREVYARARRLPGILVTGVDMHIGSQIVDLQPFDDAFALLAEFVRTLRADGHAIDHVDLGGGLGIPYRTDNEPPPLPDRYAGIVRRRTAALDCDLFLEPGRLIVGNAGILVTSVIYVKRGADRNFIIVDAAMNDLIRPTLYEAHHDILPLREAAMDAPRIVADHGSILGLDGQKGFGQAIGEQAMRMAIERASALGCCMLGLSNTHHLGRIGQWAEQCAQAGLASVHFVNALSTPLVAPWGGSDARLSTNPFCVGVPREPEPLILDYATSKLALGKVRVAQDAGKRMAPDVLLDAAGQPTDDPAAMFTDPAGALLSFGEHKGFALAVMCELLGGALSGGSVQHEHPRPNPMINNMLSLVFAPDKLVSRADLARQVDRLEAWLKASPPRPGSTGIRLPGEPERLTARERERLGIPLPRRTCDALVASARGLGMAHREFASFESSAA